MKPIPRKSNRSIRVVLLVAASCVGQVRAIAPEHLTDERLAGSPIIVVAKWEKAAFESHHKTRADAGAGEVVVKEEAYTKLHVLRTVKGPALAEGDHDLMVGWGISWSADGTGLSAGTSTNMPGEVGDITEPNLWFLERAKSWDETRAGDFLAISNYRRIQALELEAFFVAMGSGKAASEVPRLLTPGRPAVAMRVLPFLCGGIWPWPYGPDEFDRITGRSGKRGMILKDEGKRVWELVASGGDEIRPFAVSVYAELSGKGGLGKIRALLGDKDPFVRGNAVGNLARHRDNASVEKFPQAIRGVDEAWLACKLIEVLSAWGDERLVPSLITYLQNSGFAYQNGDDFGIPALKARVALHKITGHWFPPDVDRSLNAWQQVVQVADKAKRGKLLDGLIPGTEFPLAAELIGEPEYGAARDGGGPGERNVSATVRVCNITAGPLTVAKRPDGGDLSWPAGCSGFDGGFPRDHITRDDFATLEPGQSLEFKVTLSEDFLVAYPDTRSLKLSYRNNGKALGLAAWIGTLKVARGSEWKEKRETVKVEETWPNGNLKATGVTINGHKMGEWNYFNEQGDRIRVEFHGEGRGSGDCDPENPENKGRGKRPRENRQSDDKVPAAMEQAPRQGPTSGRSASMR